MPLQRVYSSFGLRYKKNERLVSLDYYLLTLGSLYRLSQLYAYTSHTWVPRKNSSPSLVVLSACALFSLMGSHLGNFFFIFYFEV
jgi:hypothetical protein